jgi:hypothetical protein
MEMTPMRPADRPRVEQVLAIFAGREEIASLGQLSDGDEKRLAWAVRRGIVQRERRPWPGPLVGTCIKTWFVRIGC